MIHFPAEIKEQRETEIGDLEGTLSETNTKLNELKAGIAKFLTSIAQADDQAEV